MTTLLMGIETEYAITALAKDGSPRPTEQTAGRLMGVAHRSIPILRQKCIGSGSGFLQNGARFYIDCGSHPEMTTPECTNPTDCVRYIGAGEAILDTLTNQLKLAHKDIGDVSIFRCNVDYAGGSDTWGCHESYLYRARPETLPRQMLPHLVSRVIYTGAGGFDSLPPGLHFTLSPRAHHLTQVVSRESQGGRSIFHTKNEGLARQGLNRLHLVCGESVSSQTSAWLKSGVTALIVSLIDAGFTPGEDVSPANPLQAMWTFSQDPRCIQTVRLENRKDATAIQIQRHYLQCAEAHLGESFMPEWAAEVCSLWRTTLDCLARDPLSLADTLDWPMKYAIFGNRLREKGFTWGQIGAWNQILQGLGSICQARRIRADAAEPSRLLSPDSPLINEKDSFRGLLEQHGLDWDQYAAFWKATSELKATDLRFGQIGPKGLFNILDARPHVLRHRIVPQESVLAATAEPPAEGRANVRGRMVRQLAEDAERYTCDWQGIWDLDSGRCIDLSDPFAPSAEWKQIASGDSDRDVDLAMLLHARRRHASAPDPFADAQLQLRMPAVLGTIERVLARVGARRDSPWRGLQTMAAGIRETGAVRVELAMDLNNIALEYRNEAHLEVAESLLRCALDIERDFYDAAHPKLPHRMNNLASVLLLRGETAEADALTREAWRLKAGRHDVTSGRILSLRVILACLTGTPAGCYIGQLRTLLNARRLRSDGGVATQWNFDEPIRMLRTRISEDQCALVSAIVSALQDRGRRTALHELPAWNDAGDVPLDHPWPDLEPDSPF